MLTYCLKCRRNTKNRDAKMIKTKNRRLALSSKCVVCGSKKIKIYESTRSRSIIE